MDTSVKLNKEFLRLLDCIRRTEKGYWGSTMSRIHCKENILCVTNGLMALKCNLKQEQLPVFELEDGYYEVSGGYLVQDKKIEGIFPDVDIILNNDFVKYFRPLYDPKLSYLSFIHTLSCEGIRLNYVSYEKQFKQVFKGSDFTVFLGENKKGVVLVELSYPILSINVNVTANVSFLVMPMGYGLPEIKEIKYNPIKDEKPFPKENEKLV